MRKNFVLSAAITLTLLLVPTQVFNLPRRFLTDTYDWVCSDERHAP